MGTSSFERFTGMFGVGDVLVHAWDLARATGLDERLDEDEVHRLFTMMEPNDAMMRQGTAFGPKVEPPPGADEQTKLLAFTRSSGLTRVPAALGPTPLLDRVVDDLPAEHHVVALHARR